jgi:hypothetical protein
MLEEKLFCILLGLFLIIIFLRWPFLEKFNNYIHISSLSNSNCVRSCGTCQRYTKKNTTYKNNSKK